MIANTHKVLIITALFLINCGTTEEDPQPKYPNAITYCTGRAQAECGAEVLTACAVADEDTCIKERQDVCEESLLTNKIYNSSKAEDCISKVATAYADAKLSKLEIDNYTKTCDLLFDGTGDADDTCSKNTDCKQSQGLQCVIHIASSTTRGTCQVAKTIAAGESCEDADAQCATGFHCSADNYCIANADLDDPCDSTMPCKDAYKCSSDGYCEDKLVNSSVCTNNNECASGICSQSGTSNICLAQITLSASEPFCIAAAGRN
ncbi:MAG: hypothetical protein JW841_04555 [Deltaproteobacteria bacterium]|nr:hypothetical protein [Deltaproteobacteria bacterium]